MAAAAQDLTASQARRIALAAQGLADPVPARVSRRPVQLAAAVRRLGLLQLDSVNVVVRSHYLPLFSRGGAYERADLDALSATGPRRLFEYWGHEASLLPVELQPLFRWRMARARDEAWGSLREVATAHKDFVAAVRQVVADSGPLTAGQVEHEMLGERTGGRGSWWDWSLAKQAVEYLFWCGELSAAFRVGFERRYDLTERVLPAAVLARPTPTPTQAWRELMLAAAAALGVGTEQDLRDYYRLRPEQARPVLAELLAAGELQAVRVQGWSAPAYLHPAARLPRAARSSALLSPFDSLIFFRARTERLFNFRYRLEFYTPAHKRVHGYYVMPLLLGEHLVARVDVRADRASGVLQVLAVILEPAAPGEVVDVLADRLAELATWLGLELGGFPN